MLLQSKQFLKGSGQLLSPTKKAELDSKMSILEARWGRLQAELDNRYMRLVRIHEKLTKFEELLHPFLVCIINEMFEKRINILSNKVLSSILVNQLSIDLSSGHGRSATIELSKVPYLSVHLEKSNWSELFSQPALPFEWLNLTEIERKKMTNVCRTNKRRKA